MTKDRIIIGADHAGFFLKENLKEYLSRGGFTVVDVGAHSEAAVDYPDYGIPVAAGVAAGDFPRGILICASGVGMSIVANRFPGIRAALALDEETARMSRLHNDTNILVLAGKKTPPDEARRIVEAWLQASFEGGRHARRLGKIEKTEKRAKPDSSNG